MSEYMDPADFVQLDFEGVEAGDSDVPSMSKLLNQLVRESGVDSEQLAKVLVSQNYVGSVLKPCADDVEMDDDEDPEDQCVYAITSIINVTRRKEEVLQDVLGFLHMYVQEKSVTTAKDSTILKELTSDDGVPDDMTLGLLIKERMVNMPVALLHPSLESLMSDVNNAVQRKMPYKFTHFMYWAKMYVSKGVSHHCDIEDSWFDENSLSYFNYKLENADTIMVEEDADGAIPTRRVYIVEFAKFQAFIDHVKSVSLNCAMPSALPDLI